jgi:hypothetical protein
MQSTHQQACKTSAADDATDKTASAAAYDAGAAAGATDDTIWSAADEAATTALQAAAAVRCESATAEEIRS